MGVVYFSIIPTFEPSRYCKCWIVCFYYRRMDQKKEQMYVCDVDGGMEKTVGNEAGKD